MKDKLKKLGLSDYESAVYIALLKHGPKKGKPLAGLAKIPRTSVYSNLESLEKKAFITLIQKSPRIYKAKEPEIAIHAYIEREHERLKEKAEQTIEDLKAIDHTHHDSPNLIDVFVGKRQSYRAADELSSVTKREMLVIGSGQKAALVSATHKWVNQAKRGVKVKVIIAEYAEHNKDLVEYLKKNKVQIRHYPLKDLALIVSDRKIAHIAIMSDKLEEKRLVLRVVHEEFAKMQADFFNNTWKKAKSP
ncbi:MAG: TrmB family transcriptional regulator [Candidatus Nanoarchaeia archaeon]